jgi:hypothetical protein
MVHEAQTYPSTARRILLYIQGLYRDLATIYTFVDKKVNGPLTFCLAHIHFFFSRFISLNQHASHIITCLSCLTIIKYFLVMIWSIND